MGFAHVFLWIAFALSASCIVAASLVLFALLLLFVGCVVGGSFSLRMIATKRKGAPCWCSLSLFVGCGFVCRSLNITTICCDSE